MKGEAWKKKGENLEKKENRTSVKEDNATISLTGPRQRLLTGLRRNSERPKISQQHPIIKTTNKK